MDGWVDGKARLRIAYTNQKVYRFTLLKTAVSIIANPTMSAIERLTMKAKTKVVDGDRLLAI